jgi:hypothetical protein
MESETSPSDLAVVVSVRGSVVEVWFKQRLLPIYSVLRPRQRKPMRRLFSQALLGYLP